MTTPPTPPRQLLGRAIGLTAFTWGYPLVESLRTCVLQTAGPARWQAPIDRLHHAENVATDADRDIVTPANDLLYCTGWINLADGPRRLTVPSRARHGGRYFVLAFYDAWTNNFENAGWRTSPPDGETLLLVGPDAAQPGAGLADGARIVRAPTNLVWLLGRVVAGPDDLPAARALLAQITLDCAPGTDTGRLPAGANGWLGPPDETIAALLADPGGRDAIADRFFANLCRSLADQAVPAADAGLLAWLATAGLRPDPAFDAALLEPEVRAGLRQGLADAVAWLDGTADSRRARGWVINPHLGRWTTRYQARALTAHRGLGALVADEAVYARTDFDAHQQPLDGSQACTMRFAPGDLPPALAFWSVTLYAQDRFLYPNPLGRHSIGDRTAGLQPDADGGLTLHIGHAAPAAAPGHGGDPVSNWLPAPAGAYYLILRLYAPGPDARTWRIPPLQPENRS
ncbi:MAG: DUF1254 domain-containing protein [Burkholderiaceae bacterium]